MDATDADPETTHVSGHRSSMLQGLHELISDDTVEEIWLNSPDRVFAARDGRTFVSGVVLNCHDLQRFVASQLLPTGRRLDALSPFVDATLPDGSRLHVVASGIAGPHLVVNIRKFPAKSWNLTDLVARGACSDEQADWLRAAVRAGSSLLVSGATHTGKTTLLRASISELPAMARVVVCEEVSELRPQRLDSVSMQTRSASLEGSGEVSLRDLVVQALRMRPELLVVGEVRQAEAFDLLLALSSGIPGMGTIHAESATGAVRKLATLALLAGSNVTTDFVVPTVASAVSAVVQLRRDQRGNRYIQDISAVSLRHGNLAVDSVDLRPVPRMAA